ncbi:uncharacterized protein FIBRA_09293 [Fibroporia radiculosa]|uniref:Uncharacterized protein n=1 Tax=Fibroporia radiculosa TaxID=599839 RepID=J7SCW7_9APHY|nr:uncharacterized protein FIBRA_09293 [Fibroporia radiculosa]CCM06978.1 predicted protein [Fibroporia radiculosa]
MGSVDWGTAGVSLLDRQLSGCYTFSLLLEAAVGAR